MENTHDLTYGKSFFNSEELSYWAKLYLKYIPDDVKIILSRGSSGCSIASAILTISPERKFEHINVPKKGEDRHLGRSPYISNSLYKRCVIVDDFIGTGSTLFNIIKYAKEYKLMIKKIIVNHTDNDLSVLIGYNQYKKLYENNIVFISYPTKTGD